MFIKIGFAQRNVIVHNEHMTFNDWLNHLPGSPTPSQAADAAKLSRATVLRHHEKNATTAEYVIKIARAYNINEIQALIDLGYVNEASVLELAIENALGMAKNSQMLAELDRRVDPDARRVFRGEGAEIVDLDDRRTTPDVQDLDYAADHRVPEPEEGDDDYGPGA